MFIEDFDEVEFQERTIGERLEQFERMRDPEKGCWDDGYSIEYPLVPFQGRLKDPVSICVFEVSFLADGRCYREKVRAIHSVQARHWMEKKYPGIYVRSVRRVRVS